MEEIKIAEITNLMSYVKILETMEGIQPVPIEEIIKRLRHESDAENVFILPALGKTQVALIRKDPNPLPFAFTDTQLEVVVTHVTLEHLVRIVPLVYEKVYFLYEEKKN